MSQTDVVDAVALAAAVRSGERSALDVTEAHLACIDRHNGAVNALLNIPADQARARARALDARRAAGETLGSLAGVPVVVKDNLCTRGLPTTCASRILEGYVPPYDAHVVERLLASDAVVIGKGNMDEFAMGSSNEHSAFGPVANPWDASRAPGGSSGGSAAAVAAAMAPLALGSDTGGSVRQPASFCGVVALKPTYGTVSRYGLVAFASSLDQVGAIGREVGDVAALHDAISGHDARDATSVDRVLEPCAAGLGEAAGPRRIGVVAGLLEQPGIQPEVGKVFAAALQQLQELGHELVDVELPHAAQAVATYYLIATAEASSNLSRFDGMRYGLRVEAPSLGETYGATRTAGFGAEVKRRIMLGTYALSAGYYDAYYRKAQQVRTLIARDYAQAFERCDALLTPTAPTSAFRLGEKTGDPLSMYLADIFTLPPSLAGLPALSMPGGVDDEGLPIGLQICGPAFSEPTLMALGHGLEERLALQLRSPLSRA